VPGGILAGVVTGPGGIPAAERLVTFMDAARGLTVARDTTAVDGSFARGLAPGQYKIRVDGGASGLATTDFDQAPVQHAAQPVAVTLGTTTNVTIPLAQGGRLRGRVTDAGTGNPVKDIQVRIDDIPRGFVTTVRTAADGSYVVSLGPGQYQVRVRTQGTN